MYLVTVWACHIEIKGYLLTYLLNSINSKAANITNKATIRRHSRSRAMITARPILRRKVTLSRRRLLAAQKRQNWLSTTITVKRTFCGSEVRYTHYLCSRPWTRLVRTELNSRDVPSELALTVVNSGEGTNFSATVQKRKAEKHSESSNSRHGLLTSLTNSVSDWMWRTAYVERNWHALARFRNVDTFLNSWYRREIGLATVNVGYLFVSLQPGKLATHDRADSSIFAVFIESSREATWIHRWYAIRV